MPGFSAIRACGGLVVAIFSLSLLPFLNPTARAGNYYIDPNYSGVSGAPYTSPGGISFTAAYSNIAAALSSTGGVPSGTSPTSPNYLYFAPGTYNVGSSSLSYSKSDVDFVGLTGNPNDVVINSYLDSSYSTVGGTSGSATLQLKGNNQSVSYITIANSVDTPYIVNVTHQQVSPTGNYNTGISQTSNSPAVALLLQGDQQVFNDVQILGYQDTLYDKGGRAYFNNSTVSGDVDFIFANGTAVFNNSTINLDSDHSGGDITAASTAKTTSNGLVFLNSTITGNSMRGNPVIDPNNAGNANPTAASSMNLGRPWGWQQVGGDSSTVFVNTKVASVGGTSIIKPAGWLAWDTNETNAANGLNGGNPAEDSRFAEYNTTDLVSGNPVSTAGRVTWSHQLTASQAAAYSVDNVFSEGYPWYGNGYSSTDTDTIGNTGVSAAGTGSANPTDPNYSWPAFWGDRNINNEQNDDTLTNDPGSYSDLNWTLGGNWDPSAQLAAAEVEIPEPATLALAGGLVLLPLMRRPRRGQKAS